MFSNSSSATAIVENFSATPFTEDAGCSVLSHDQTVYHYSRLPALQIHGQERVRMNWYDDKPCLPSFWRKDGFTAD